MTNDQGDTLSLRQWRCHARSKDDVEFSNKQRNLARRPKKSYPNFWITSKFKDFEFYSHLGTLARGETVSKLC
jgi:hypothetical protein